MKKIALFGFLLFQGTLVFSQHNTVSSGGNTISATGSVSYSVGQIDYTSTTNSNGTVSLGNQQPYELYNSAGLNEESISISIFPNPVSDVIQVKLTDFNGLKYRLTDVRGRIIQEKDLNAEQTSINMSTLSPSSYFLLIIREGKTINTTKIIKH